MARIRSVHPGLWTDESFVSASPLARLLWIGLWGEADDHGVFEWKPLALKMRLAPADGVDMTALLDELESADLIRSFSAEGRRYGAVRNFQKWQSPKKPSYKHPIPDEMLLYVQSGTSAEPVGNRYGTGRTTEEGGSGTGTEKTRKYRTAEASAPPSSEPVPNRCGNRPAEGGEEGRGRRKGRGEDLEEAAAALEGGTSRATPEPLAHLRRRIGSVFENLGRLPPETGHAATWLAAGYDPDIIVRTVKELAGRNGKVRSLRYFDDAIREAHARQDEPLEPGGKPWLRIPPESFPIMMKIWRKTPESWVRADWGPTPEEPGCVIPPEARAS